MEKRPGYILQTLTVTVTRTDPNNIARQLMINQSNHHGMAKQSMETTLEPRERQRRKVRQRWKGQQTKEQIEVPKTWQMQRLSTRKARKGKGTKICSHLR
eukprot:4429307-Amphidinium_carterae.1